LPWFVFFKDNQPFTTGPARHTLEAERKTGRCHGVF
jgi:hypothetical protein